MQKELMFMKNYIPLRVEFCLYENILCGKILQQDDRLIEQVNTEDILREDNLYRLSIIHSPDLYDNILYLRGKDKEDGNDTFTYRYTNRQAAETALNNFKELIRQVNNFYADKSTTEKTNTCFIEVCE